MSLPVSGGLLTQGLSRSVTQAWQYDSALLGTTTVVTTAPTSNTAVYFPGTSGSYMNLGNSTPSNFDTNLSNLFCEAWIYLNSFQSIATSIIGRHNTTASPAEDWMLWINGSAQPRFRVTSTANSSQDAVLATVMSTGQWYHIAGSWDNTNKRIYVFLNGVASGFTSFSGTPRYNSSWAVQLGIYTGGTGGQYINGYIRDLKVYRDGIVPTATFTPAIAPFGIANPSYASGVPVFNLGSPTPYSSIMKGTSLITTLPPTVVSLPGVVGSGLSLGANSLTNFSPVSTNVFVEMWVYWSGSTFNPPGLGLTGAMLYERDTGVSYVSGGVQDWGIYIDNTGVFQSYGYCQNGSIIRSSNATPLSVQTWTHLAYSWNQQNTTVYCFVNGGLGGATGNASSQLRYTGSTIQTYIGWSPHNVPSSYAWLGYIRDFKVYQGGNVPIATFTPVSSPFTTSNPSYATGTNVFNLGVTYLSPTLGTIKPTTLTNWPPTAFTSGSDSVTDPTYGTFVATASGSLGSYEPRYAFDKVATGLPGGNQCWATNQSTSFSTNGVVGVWLQLQMPVQIVLSTLTLVGRYNDYGQNPTQIYLFGSNNGSTFVQLLGATSTNIATTFGQNTGTYTVNASAAYSYYRIVCTQPTGTGYIALAEVYFTGTIPAVLPSSPGTMSLGASFINPGSKSFTGGGSFTVFQTAPTGPLTWSISPTGGVYFSSTTDSLCTVTAIGAIPSQTYTLTATNSSRIPRSVSFNLTNVIATGGSQTTSGNYLLYTFTTVGTSTFTVYGTVVGATVLIVGGGGGGGGSTGNGGGGGGVLYTTSGSFNPGNYTITVGTGGTGGTADNAAIGNGGDSSIVGTGLSVVAYGGGGGGHVSAGRSGGSGGGSSGASTQTTQGVYTGYGYAGGSGDLGGPNYPTSGGGGAGGVGGNVISGNPGVGGPGFYFSPTNSYYAGGGGGGWNFNATGGAGGSGGGGSGGKPPVAGTANTGGGGGGCNNFNGGGSGASGGSGIVIIAIPTDQSVSTPILTNPGTQTLQTYGSAQTITVNQTADVGYTGTITWSFTALPAGMSVQSTTDSQIVFIVAVNTNISSRSFTVTANSQYSTIPASVTFTLSANPVYPNSLVVSGYTYVPFSQLPTSFTLTAYGGASNGNPWYRNGNTLYDGPGSGGSIQTFYPTQPGDIYSTTRSGIWYTLGNNAGLYAHHSGYDMYMNGYSAGNFDFAWCLYLQNGTTDKVIVYNPFPGDNVGFWVQSANGRIRINTQTPSAAQVYTISPSLDQNAPSLTNPGTQTITSPGTITVYQTKSTTQTGTITWSYSTLPSGMTVQSSSGTQIVFAITSGSAIASQSFTVSATGSNSSTTASVTFTISATNPAAASLINPGNQNLNTSSSAQTITVLQAASTGLTGTITWSYSTLPSGMTVQSSSGTQIVFSVSAGTTIASQSFTVTATSANAPSQPSSVTFTLVAGSTPGTLASLSGSAWSSAQGIYGLRALYSTSATIMTVRRSTDNQTVDVISDTVGNLTVNTGGTYTTWIGAATGYVTKWWDQSAAGNHATQSSTGSQPTYDATNKQINFRTSAWMSMPNGTIPFGNTNYTFVFRHNTITTGQNCFIGSGGYGTVNAVNSVEINGGTYLHYWWGNDMGGGGYLAGATVSFKYNNTVGRTSYRNGTQQATNSSTTRNSTNVNNTIGCDWRNNAAGVFLNGELYYVQIYGSTLSDADRTVAESVVIT